MGSFCWLSRTKVTLYPASSRAPFPVTLAFFLPLLQPYLPPSHPRTFAHADASAWHTSPLIPVWLTHLPLLLPCWSPWILPLAPLRNPWPSLKAQIKSHLPWKVSSDHQTQKSCHPSLKTHTLCCVCACPIPNWCCLNVFPPPGNMFWLEDFHWLFSSV